MDRGQFAVMLNRLIKATINETGAEAKNLCCMCNNCLGNGMPSPESLADTIENDWRVFDMLVCKHIYDGMNIDQCSLNDIDTVVMGKCDIIIVPRNNRDD